MPPVETTAREQDATLWAYSTDDRHGEPVVSSPVDIQVRWVDKSSEIMNSDNTPISVTGRVVVNVDVAEGSLLRQGKVDDLPDIGSDGVLDGLLEVVGFDKTPDLKNRNYRRVCIVRKYQGRLPVIV